MKRRDQQPRLQVEYLEEQFSPDPILHMYLEDLHLEIEDTY